MTLRFRRADRTLGQERIMIMVTGVHQGKAAVIGIVTARGRSSIQPSIIVQQAWLPKWPRFWGRQRTPWLTNHGQIPFWTILMPTILKWLPTLMAADGR